MSDPKPTGHTLDAIRALLDVPEERLALYLADISKGALLDIARHLVDVVGRQHEEVERGQWGDDGHCWECGNGLDFNHGQHCALAALLRETA
jgi:hypothetical protein